MGDTADAFANCEHIFEGKTEQNGQEHLYIETQGAYAVPMENGGMRVYSSTQGPTAVQRAVCRVTGLAMHQVEVDVQAARRRFGGKEDQANAWAGIVAVATQLTKRPLKYALHRMEDMRATGKRHPYSSDYKIGLDKDLKIVAYGASFSKTPAPPATSRHRCSNALCFTAQTHISSQTSPRPPIAAAQICPQTQRFAGLVGAEMFVIESTNCPRRGKTQVFAGRNTEKEPAPKPATNSLTAR